MAQNERRQQVRYPLRIDIEVSTSRERVHVETVDLSTDGIRVISPRPISPGTTITTQFPIDPEAHFRGQVIWVLETARVGLPAYEIGIGMASLGIGDRSAVGHAETLAMIQTIIETHQARGGES